MAHGQEDKGTHTFLVAFQFEGLPGEVDRKMAEGILARYLPPGGILRRMSLHYAWQDDRVGRRLTSKWFATGLTGEICWWVAEDDRQDRSDNDSAVFVPMGEQPARYLKEEEI